jgi:hypothetical protein
MGRIQTRYIGLVAMNENVRSAYISALQKTNKGNIQPFLHFISEMVYKSSKEYLRLIQSAM